MSFASLKKSSKNAIETISKKFEQEKSGGYAKDDRYWRLEVDKTGNGMAVIRFLPAPGEEEVPYVKRFEYFVKHNGKNYVEFCRSTLGEKDPMNEYFFERRGDGKNEARNTAAKAFSRGTNYIANILVIDDPMKPENNGKVFLYKFGSRIFQKLEGAITPEFKDETPFNPFDFWTGANFKLKARMLDNQRSYDKSGFDVCSPLCDGDDDELEKIWKQEYSLQAEIAPDKFKSYDELKKKRDWLLAEAGAPEPEAGRQADDDLGIAQKSNAQSRAAEREEPAAVRKSEAAKPAKAASNDGDDDDMARYRAMLED